MENDDYMISKLACSCSLCSSFTSSIIGSVAMSKWAVKTHNVQGVSADDHDPSSLGTAELSDQQTSVQGFRYATDLLADFSISAYPSVLWA